MTVEAALIMPVVLFLILFLIYMGFYLYDRCSMEEDLHVAALRGSNLWMLPEAACEDELNKTHLYLNRDEYIALNRIQQTAQLRAGRIHVSAAATMKTPLSLIWSPDGFQSNWEIQTAFATERYQPGDFLRDCRKVEYLADQISKRPEP